MRLCLDLQALQSESAERGVGRYTSGLANAIIRSGRVQTEALLNAALHQKFSLARQWAAERLPSERIRVFTGLDRVMGLIDGAGVRADRAAALFESYIRSINIDALHTGAPFDGMGDNSIIGDPRLGAGSGIIRTASLYDLIPFQEPERYLADPRYKSWFGNRLNILHSYDLLFAISDHTRQVAIDFGKFDPARVVAISTDTTDIFRPISMDEADRAALLGRYNITRPFVMHTGILEERKNVKCLIAAFAALPTDLRQTHELVLVTRFTDAQRADTLNYANAQGLDTRQIVLAGFLPDNDLAKLYNLTKVLVMPSSAEGFGLPLLEAMRCGAAVLGANATSIPEVVGAADYLFSPNDSRELSTKLTTLLRDDVALGKARQFSKRQQEAFSWDASAKRMLDAVTDYRSSAAPQVPSRARFQFYSNLNDSRSTELSARLEMAHGEALPGSDTIRFPVIVADTAFSAYQEDLLINAPHVLIVSESASTVTCSRELYYKIFGYAALMSLGQGMPKIAREALNRVPNSLVLKCLSDVDISERAIISIERECHRRFTALKHLIETTNPPLSEADAAELARAAALNLFNGPHQKTLFVDISELVHRDARTGIQRVVRNILSSLLSQPRSYRIEPIYRDGDYYKYATRYTTHFMGIPSLNLPDQYVEFRSGDIFLGLDLDALITPQAMAQLAIERSRGVKLIWIVYDLLPVHHPEWFGEGLSKAVQNWIRQLADQADQLICISEAVADDVRAYLQAVNPQRILPTRVTSWPLGADLDSQTAIAPDQPSQIPAALSAAATRRPIFITVGTIEPRKGIKRLLDGAEAFWSSGGEAVFVLVGREGWAVNKLTQRIRTHKELNRRLFWFDDADDALLSELYECATAALLPSEGEGFGLPLIESAHRGKPVIARDLKVFREVGGENAYYFKEERPEQFSDALHDWLSLYARDLAPKPYSKVLSWYESTSQLYEKATV